MTPAHVALSVQDNNTLKAIYIKWISKVSYLVTESSFQPVSAHTDPIDLWMLDDFMRWQVTQAHYGLSWSDLMGIDLETSMGNRCHCLGGLSAIRVSYVYKIINSYCYF